MGDLVIYTASADLTLLRAIFNGVAMICALTTFIWGFAILASTWRITHSVAASSLEGTSGQSGAILSRGSMGAVVPLILAMLLTVPGLQSRVIVESTFTGAATVIDNVPFVIAVIPAGGSLVSKEVGAVVTTAFQAVGTDYPALSASNNGFINPLKVLLSSRSAVLRLSSIDSEIKSVVASCLGSDAGVDYALITRLVMNAGNTGATAAQTAPIFGVTQTSVGALLYQAAQNTSGLVNGLGPAGSVLNCPDAVQLVINDIDAAIGSTEFARVVQGSVNGMDQPVSGAAFDVTTLQRQYTALRTANTVTNTLAGGAQQAQAELINLLFAELVDVNLGCLRADGPDKVACEAAMVQAAEVERTNIQAAAKEVPMLQYAGSLANQLLALIIGLGPVVIMFMMFAGVNAGKSIKTAVHIMVWPLLVLNVGAELVNGIIGISIANFMSSIAQGGFISQASAVTVYKQLSLQIGTASHIMASLPVLMAIIFSMGEASALTSTASSLPPKSTDVANNATPKPIEDASLVRGTSMATVSHMASGYGLKVQGGVDAVSASVELGSKREQANRSISNAFTKQRTVSEGETNLADWSDALRTGRSSSLRVDDRVLQSVNRRLEASSRDGSDTNISTGVSSSKATTVDAAGGVRLGGGLSAGSGSRSGGFSGGLDASGNVRAQDGLQTSKGSDVRDSYSRSKALSQALNDELQHAEAAGYSKETVDELRRSVGLQRNYQSLVSDSSSNSDTSLQAVEESKNFVTYAQRNIGATEIASAYNRNAEFGLYQATEGKALDANPSFAKYREKASARMDTLATDAVGGDQGAKDAVVRYAAAADMALDEQASPKDRLAATQFLNNSVGLMLGKSVKLQSPDLKEANIAAPSDRTGVNASSLHRRGAGMRGPAPMPTGPTAELKKAAGERVAEGGPSGGQILNEANRQQMAAVDAGLNPYGGSRVDTRAARAAGEAIKPTDEGVSNSTQVGQVNKRP